MPNKRNTSFSTISLFDISLFSISLLPNKAKRLSRVLFIIQEDRDKYFVYFIGQIALYLVFKAYDNPLLWWILSFFYTQFFLYDKSKMTWKDTAIQLSWHPTLSLHWSSAHIYYLKKGGKIHKNWGDIKHDPVNPSEWSLTRNTTNNNSALDSTRVKFNKRWLSKD